ncbi:hypothetical protein LPJ61_000890 [Coemansia biformis]|uniref:Thioesterase domain-containing protein n=1 Tax=Coemansia biformis TaxID=1286918 RepID=A0A9W7YHZ7_9FUNG|nr:hypothetical protein LPJ61_000890 [Coemansia biformis]
MEASCACAREAYFWPLGKRKLRQAPETLMFGALAGSNDLPAPPLVFRWTGAGLPRHVNTAAYNGSFETPEQQRWSAGQRVPGASMVFYLGRNLAFRSTAGGAAGKRAAAHPGVAAMLLDDVTARVCFANTPERPPFTANLQLDYLYTVRAASTVVADAWVTRIDGRKTFVSAYAMDAQSGKLLVRARSLFVSAAA